MTDYRPPWERPLGDICAIPVHLDPEVPAGTAVFDLDPEEPRHITRVRTGARGEFELTAEQYEQVRDHYRAMDERAGRALVDYQRLMAAAIVADPRRRPPHHQHLTEGDHHVPR